MAKRTSILCVFIIAIMIALSGCVTENTTTGNQNDDITTVPDIKEPTSELKKFSSAEEINEFLKKSSTESSFGQHKMTGIIDDSLKESTGMISAPVGGVASDYSTTNIQVKDVDEPDFVKNDNKYIYLISENKLVIVDAYPAENANIISQTEVNGTPQNIFINKDRLVVFTQHYDYENIIAKYDYIPRSTYTQKTHALIYDISNKENPELIKDYNLQGNYYEARMIDNYVYFIVKESTYNSYYYDYGNIVVPIVRESSDTLLTSEVYYFDNPEYNYNFNTIVSFDIFGKENSLNAKTYMLGYSNNLYVSKNNIYITYQKNMPWNYYTYAKKEIFFEVIVPILPTDAAEDIKSIEGNKNLNDYEKWEKISERLEKMYNEMEDETAKRELMTKIAEAVLEYETKEQAEKQKTIIHKINIDKGKITYKTKGEVPGYLLNQFSMDEHENNFRVATTTSLWIRNKGQVQYNNVFVLDEEMKEEGKITGIAPDERIYSTRFIGDRLYMVTFKRIDPFFVIDLSSPKNPKILGELKIPGFSDYLHPYDQNHVIGIGKETDSNQWGGTSIKGVKIALFDVSDVENPKQVDKYEIGTSGTDSEALRDHKAFLFNKEKNILVIPIRKVEGNDYRKRSYWYGAYVLGITPEDGISKKGTITHSDYIQREDYYYYQSAYEVRRSLYMDDVLYTISSKLIKMNNLDNLDEEINEIKLPYSKSYRDYYW